MLEVYLQPEFVISFLGFKISNTLLVSLLASFFLVIFTVFFSLKKESKDILVESLRVLIWEILKLIDSVTKNRGFSKKILPLVATLFLFITTSNLLGLLPGFLGSFFVETSQGRFSLLRSPNSDLNSTFALAIISVLSMQYFSIKTLGFKSYLRKFFNLKSPIKFFVGFFELLSEFTKLLSLSFRLFGNILSGEILLLVMAFIFPYFIPVPFMILELFVGIIQAFIFAMLTLTFIKTSTIRYFE